MIKAYKNLAIATTLALVTGCTGTPVKLGSDVSGPIPTGTERNITAEACGFQLLLFIPIKINNRMERAYSQLEMKAGGDFITDVKVKEEWVYGFVGTEYCTTLNARAIRPQPKQS